MFWRSFLQTVSFGYDPSIQSKEDDDDGCDCVDDNI